MSEKLNPPAQAGRNWGVDLLRVVSTVMIVAVHILTQGGVLENAAGAAWYASWLLRSLLIVDVNCFALITGYVSASSRFKLSRVIMMWLQVWGISVAVSVVFRLLGLCAFAPENTLLPAGEQMKTIIQGDYMPMRRQQSGTPLYPEVRTRPRFWNRLR